MVTHSIGGAPAAAGARRGGSGARKRRRRTMRNSSLGSRSSAAVGKTCRALMPGASRSWLLRCLCGMAPRLPMMPRGSSARQAGVVLEQETKTGDDLPGAAYGTAVPARRRRRRLWHRGRRPVEQRGAGFAPRPCPCQSEGAAQWLRASALQAFHQRWSGVVTVAAQRALAATLAGLPSAAQDAKVSA